MYDHDALKSDSQGLGTVLAAVAILVQAPRLVLSILAADRLPIAAQAEQSCSASRRWVRPSPSPAAASTSPMRAALTAPRWRLPLGIAWLLVLTASAGLVAPAIAARLADQQLHEVVSSPALRAAWAVLAALAHELTAAGCMLAAAASSRSQSAEELELRLYAERDAAVDRAERAERALSGAASELASAAEPLLCEDCGRAFPSKQARAGHQRTCPSRIARTRPIQGES